MNRILSGIQKVNLALGTFSGLLVMGLVIAVVPEVMSRSLFGLSILGASEASVLILVITVFFGLAGAQVRREHFRVVVLETQLSGGWLRAVTLVRMVICVLAAAALSWYSIRGAYTSTLRQEMSYAVIAFPLWPARIVIATGFVMLTLQYIVDLILELRGGSSHTVETIPGEGLA